MQDNVLYFLMLSRAEAKISSESLVHLRAHSMILCNIINIGHSTSKVCQEDRAWLLYLPFSFRRYANV